MQSRPFGVFWCTWHRWTQHGQFSPRSLCSKILRWPLQPTFQDYLDICWADFKKLINPSWPRVWQSAPTTAPVNSLKASQRHQCDLFFENVSSSRFFFSVCLLANQRQKSQIWLEISTHIKLKCLSNPTHSA